MYANLLAARFETSRGEVFQGSGTNNEAFQTSHQLALLKASYIASGQTRVQKCQKRGPPRRLPRNSFHSPLKILLTITFDKNSQGEVN